MSARPFNTSSKDPVSTKLRNLHASKSATRQLEVDSRRMEARLRELKLTMSEEKQERERQGSVGFWRSGKVGALTTPSNKCVKKTSRSDMDMNRNSKPQKIKVLRDEPIKLPTRPAKTATDLTVRRSFKGPACGQCEEKAAALKCMECGELYCAACFAHFHMKGALKHHRSVPYQAGQEMKRSSGDGALTSRMHKMDPVLKTDNNYNNTAITQQKKPVVMTTQQSEISPPDMNGSSLLNGEYNEEDSSALFAAALAEWRGQEQTDTSRSVLPQHSPRRVVATANEGTGTDLPPKQEIKIEFTEVSMSYADKLLLKKHRRTELPYIATPTFDISRDCSSRLTEPFQNGLINEFDNDVDNEEEMELEEEHQRYASLFSSSDVSLCAEGFNETTSRSVLITPLPDDYVMIDIEEQTSYIVQEKPDTEPDIYYPHQEISTSMVKTDPSSNMSELKGNKTEEVTGNEKATKMNCTTKSTSQSKQRLLPKPPSSKGRSTKTDKEIQHLTNDTCGNDVIKQSTKVVTTKHKENKSDTQRTIRQKKTTDANKNLPKTTYPTESSSSIEKEKKGKHTEMNRRKEKLMPKRPASAQHEKDGRALKIDGRSSRIKKRSASAGINNNCITRQPSEELVWTSKLAWKAQHQYKHGLNEFFMAGLEDNHTEGGQGSNMDSRNQGNVNLVECSFQGPELWRPDSSLCTSLPSYTAVTQFIPEDTTTDTSQTLNQDQQHYSTVGCATPERLDSRKVSLHWKPSYEQRPSSCIEIHGDNFSSYDEDLTILEQEVTIDDEDTLNQLTSELMSARYSDDGQLSSLSMLDDFPDGQYSSTSIEAQLGITQDNGLGSGLSTPCDEFNFEQEMDEESDIEEERIASVMEVKALE